ncbi:MAG: DinB family protein [Candidatus Kerfeldbacteria bacterium]|nr:DinB family protein [Candidatus Kerfeldbacteria bacterium]
MNAKDILAHGHRDVYQALDGLTMEDWQRAGVTGRWSLKDMAAHLASYELFLEDALKFVLGREPRPTLEAMISDRVGFDNQQVANRQALSAAEILTEYGQAHQRVAGLVEELGSERLRQVGTIPWYGPEYSLDDFIVYANYGHKREHVIDITTFRRTAHLDRRP